MGEKQTAEPSGADLWEIQPAASEALKCFETGKNSIPNIHRGSIFLFKYLIVEKRQI